MRAGGKYVPCSCQCPSEGNVDIIRFANERPTANRLFFFGGGGLHCCWHVFSPFFFVDLFIPGPSGSQTVQALVESHALSSLACKNDIGAKQHRQRSRLFACSSGIVACWSGIFVCRFGKAAHNTRIEPKKAAGKNCVLLLPKAFRSKKGKIILSMQEGPGFSGMPYQGLERGGCPWP